jgi:hypothetical protein
VDVDEGILDDDFSGRKWDVTARTASDSRSMQTQAKTERKAAEQSEKDRAHDAKVLQAIDQLDPRREGTSVKAVRTIARLNADDMDRAIFRLTTEGVIEEIPDFKITAGKGAKRSARGIRRRTLDDHRDHRN